MSLYTELKRRNVLRMVVLYAVFAWLVMQVAEVLIDLAKLPDWIGTTTLGLLAIGFPIALIFSWFYELTPAGISLEKDVDRAQSITHVTGRRLDFIVISLLCAAVILFAYDKWWIGPPPEKSIAVLPFQNMSGDPEQEYFSDGLSETLIHVLAQVSGLKVAAKTSSFHFKGKNMDVSEIARQLQVGTLLAGSIQKVGNRVRIIAQLINAGDGTHLWSKSFDRDVQDIFVVQDEIAQEVVKALKVTLLDAEQERLVQRYRPTLEAYEQLILGRHEMAKRTADSLSAAERHFKQAIELDPDYALPYVDLAHTYGLQIIYGSLVFEQSLQRRQPLVEKALELDPVSGEAHLERAYLREHQQLQTGEENSRAVEEDILRAMQLSPNSVEIRRWYSNLLSSQGRFEEALAQIRVAAGLDPMSPIIQLDVAGATWDVGRAEEALTLIRRSIEQTPEFPVNYKLMALYQMQLGHLGAAQWWIQEAMRRNPDDAYSWLIECLGFLSLDDVLSAEDCAQQLGEVHPDKVVSSALWWLIHRYRDEWKAAIATLESVSERVPGFRPFDWWLADLVAGQGDVERARRLMAGTFPELLEDQFELEFDRQHLFAAVVFAAILDANDESQRRDVLLLALEERIATMHRTRGIGYGILDVYIHVMRGNLDRAIAGLREAIDMGWRVSGDTPENGCWWMLRQDWKLAILHQDPEFIAMMDELEADIDAQRQLYEESKDKPLF